MATKPFSFWLMCLPFINAHGRVKMMQILMTPNTMSTVPRMKLDIELVSNVSVDTVFVEAMVLFVVHGVRPHSL